VQRPGAITSSRHKISGSLQSLASVPAEILTPLRENKTSVLEIAPAFPTFPPSMAVMNMRRLEDLAYTVKLICKSQTFRAFTKPIDVLREQAAPGSSNGRNK